MSSEISPESAADKRAGPPLPTVVRVAVYGSCWLPFVGMVVFFVPRFDDLFAQLSERGELPALTVCLIWFSRLNVALLCLPCLLLFALPVVADPGQTIEPTGAVQTGDSTFVNVVISGTEQLGFSPAEGMKLGGAPIGPDAMVEVYGTTGAVFEPEIPDALAPPVADPVSGYGQSHVAVSESQLSGKITLEAGALDPGAPVYVGQAGDTFDLIVTGEAWLTDFTTFPPENVLLPEGSVNIDAGFIVDTSGISLASPGLYWQEFRSEKGVTLKIVPEPSTLVLLMTGGLGFLLWWRRGAAVNVRRSPEEGHGPSNASS